MEKVELLAIIDDDDVFQYITNKYIKQLHLADRIIFFNNGKEAIDFFQQDNVAEECPDMILVDTNMPIMDGWEFLTEFQKIIKNMEKPVKVCLLTSSIDERDILKAKEFSFLSDYLEKPLDQQKLLQLF